MKEKSVKKTILTVFSAAVFSLPGGDAASAIRVLDHSGHNNQPGSKPRLS